MSDVIENVRAPNIAQMSWFTLHYSLFTVHRSLLIIF